MGLGDDKTAHDLRQVFQLIDSDRGGNISLDEVRLFLQAQPASRPSAATVERIFRQQDTDGSGDIDEGEFIGLVNMLTAECDLTAAGMAHNFTEWCYEDLYSTLGDGEELRVSDLRALVESMGSDTLTGEDIRKIFSEQDSDGSGTIDLNEFKGIAQSMGRDMPISALVHSFKAAKDMSRSRMQSLIAGFGKDPPAAATPPPAPRQRGLSEATTARRSAGHFSRNSHRRGSEVSKASVLSGDARSSSAHRGLDEALAAKLAQLAQAEAEAERVQRELEEKREEMRRLDAQRLKKRRGFAKQQRQQDQEQQQQYQAAEEGVSRERLMLLRALEIRTGEVQLLQGSLVQVARFLNSPGVARQLVEAPPQQPALSQSIGKTLGAIIAHATESAKADAEACLGSKSIEGALQSGATAEGRPIHIANKNYPLQAGLLVDIAAKLRQRQQQPLPSAASAAPPASRRSASSAAPTPMSAMAPSPSPESMAAAAPAVGLPVRGMSQTLPQGRAARAAQARSRSVDPGAAGGWQGGGGAEVADLREKLARAQSAIVAGAGASCESDIKLYMARKTLSAVVRSRSASPEASAQHRSLSAVSCGMSAGSPGGVGGGGARFVADPVGAPVFSPDAPFLRGAAATRSRSPASPSPVGYAAGGCPDLSEAPPSVRNTIMQVMSGAVSSRARTPSPSPGCGVPVAGGHGGRGGYPASHCPPAYSPTQASVHAR